MSGQSRQFGSRQPLYEVWPLDAGRIRVSVMHRNKLVRHTQQQLTDPSQWLARYIDIPESHPETAVRYAGRLVREYADSFRSGNVVLQFAQQLEPKCPIIREKPADECGATTKRTRPACSGDDIKGAVAALTCPTNRQPAKTWPPTRPPFAKAPGLYSWWVDAEGACHLSEGLELAVESGLVYVGQAGATKWPSGKVPAAVLRTRIQGQHLRGNIKGSTLRHTLGAILCHQLNLRLRVHKVLTDGGEAALSTWMREHLAIAIFEFDNRDTLKSLEGEGIRYLKPPLNCDGVREDSPMARRVSALRGEFLR